MSTRKVCNHMYLNSIKKKLHSKRLFSSKKLIFAFLKQKIVKCKKTLPKHRLTLVHYNVHTWAKIHFNITRA